MEVESASFYRKVILPPWIGSFQARYHDVHRDFCLTQLPSNARKSTRASETLAAYHMTCSHRLGHGPGANGRYEDERVLAPCVSSGMCKIRQVMSNT